jgi:hypothetical protein
VDTAAQPGPASGSLRRGGAITWRWEPDGRPQRGRDRWRCTRAAPTVQPDREHATADAPPPCNTHELVYHERLKMVLLVNCAAEGRDVKPGPTRIWGWDGSGWQLLSADGPPQRSLGGVANDSRRDLLLYGGRA